MDRNVISVTFLDQINALLLKHRGQWKIRLQKHLLCGPTTQKRIAGLFSIKSMRRLFIDVCINGSGMENVKSSSQKPDS